MDFSHFGGVHWQARDSVCENINKVNFAYNTGPLTFVLHHQTWPLEYEWAPMPPIHSFMHLLPPSHHWKIHPFGSPWSRCLSSPACTACRSLSSRTCRSGTACCSSASQTGNMLPGQREAQRCYRREERGRMRSFRLCESRCSPLLHRSCSRVRAGSRSLCRYCKPERGLAAPHQTPRHCCKQRVRRI